MIATDYSDGMIKEAKKGSYPNNLTFEVADAANLPYPDGSFDAVIIANALHILPDPQKALGEIDRVLKEDGLLIAPNFVDHKKGAGSALWSKILSIAGVKFEHQWSADEYRDFLEVNGWKVMKMEEMPARITLVYTECIKQDHCAAKRKGKVPIKGEDYVKKAERSFLSTSRMRIILSSLYRMLSTTDSSHSEFPGIVNPSGRHKYIILKEDE